MIQSFMDTYFDKSYSPERKGFFLMAFSALFMFAYSVVVCVLLKYGLLSVVGIVMGMIVVVADIYFANLTKRYTICSILLIFIINCIELPAVYIFRGRLMSGCVIYLLLGIVFCVVALEGYVMYAALIISSITIIGAIVYGYYFFEPFDYSARERMLLFVEVGVALIPCGVLAGSCVKLRTKFYADEKEKAENARVEASTMDEAKNVFLSNMSHEIRTPMNAILGNSQLLLETDIQDTSKDYVINILNACNALISSVGDVLDFSRIEIDRIAIEETEYSLNEVHEDIINMMSIRIMDKGIELITDIDPAIPELLIGDCKHLRLVITNLISSAIKYTKKGYIKLSVKLQSIADKKANILINVTDTGAGFNTVEINNLFGDTMDEAKAADSQDSDNGVNLSMRVCREIVDRMGGRIEVESEPGKGTSITISVSQGYKEIKTDSRVTLNMARVLVFEKSEECDKSLAYALEQCGVSYKSISGTVMFREALSAEPFTHIFIDSNNYMELADFLTKHIGNARLIVLADSNHTNAAGQPGNVLIRPVYYNNVFSALSGTEHSSIRRMSLRGAFKCPDIRVMVVDDNQTNLMVVEAILSRYDIQVFTASGGQECLNRLEGQQVDIIFMDYMMPEMDGIDTLKNIRKMDMEWTKTVPIISLTANAVGGVREMLLSEGFDDYLSKPIEINKLEKCIYKFLPEDAICPVID